MYTDNSSRLDSKLAVRDLSHPHAFDPTYGFSLGELLLLKAPEAPANFDAFWQNHYAETLTYTPSLETEEIPARSEGRRLYRIRLKSTDGITLLGWLDVPRDGIVESLTVQLHGYGGRSEPEANPPRRGAVLQPGLRGLPPSLHPVIPAPSSEHVLHGIEDRYTYVLRGCVADVWCAASALLSLYPQAAKQLYYKGASFGGGIGALALAFDPRFSRAYLAIPTFGNHPLRLVEPCTGSGEAVRLYSKMYPKVSEVLAYYDAATAATRIRIPTLVAPALFDPAVPPPGQFTIYNALAGEKFLYIRKAGHFEFDGLQADLDDEAETVNRFFEGEMDKPSSGCRLAPSLSKRS